MMLPPLSPPEYPDLPWCDDCQKPHEKVSLILEGRIEQIPCLFANAISIAHQVSENAASMLNAESLSAYSGMPNSSFDAFGIQIPKPFYSGLAATSEWQILSSPNSIIADPETIQGCWAEVFSKFTFNSSEMEAEYSYSLCQEKRTADMAALYFVRELIEFSEY